jgi:hypothetical protein
MIVNVKSVKKNWEKTALLSTEYVLLVSGVSKENDEGFQGSR